VVTQLVSGIRSGQGLWLSGRFLSLEDMKPYTDKLGNPHQPVRMGLLVGRMSYGIEFPDRDSAVAACGGCVPEELGDVTVPVFANGPWNPADRKRGPVFFSGRRMSDTGE
jgi:hypothetical protein